MTTLGEATRLLAAQLKSTRESVINGACTPATLIDTTINEQAAYFANGTLWMLSGAHAGRSSRIVSYDNATHAFTFDPFAPAIAPAPGDRYAVTNFEYPRWLLIQAINEGVRKIGRVPYEKQVASVDGKELYNTDDDPVFGKEVIGIQVALNTVAPYNFCPVYQWEPVAQTKPGIRFFPDCEPDDGVPMAVLYLDAAPALALDTDSLTTFFALERVIAEAKVYAFTWRYNQTKGEDAHIVVLLNAAQVDAQQMGLRYPAPDMKPTTLSRWL